SYSRIPMSIRFVCRCGKHLRARNEMAARRSVCPRCGSPVGIPAQGPDPFDEEDEPVVRPRRVRLRPILPHTFAESEDVPEALPVEPEAASPYLHATLLPDADVPVLQPLDGDDVRPRSRRIRRSRRWRAGQLEGNWLQCGSYPFRILWAVLGISSGLT